MEETAFNSDGPIYVRPDYVNTLPALGAQFRIVGYWLDTSPEQGGVPEHAVLKVRFFVISEHDDLGYTVIEEFPLLYSESWKLAHLLVAASLADDVILEGGTTYIPWADLIGAGGTCTLGRMFNPADGIVSDELHIAHFMSPTPIYE